MCTVRSLPGKSPRNYLFRVISYVINSIKHNFSICWVGSITAIIFNVLTKLFTYLVRVHLKGGTSPHTTYRDRRAPGFR